MAATMRASLPPVLSSRTFSPRADLKWFFAAIAFADFHASVRIANRCYFPPIII